MYILTSRSFQVQTAAKGVEISIHKDMNINNKFIPSLNPKLAISREIRPQQLVQVSTSSGVNFRKNVRFIYLLIDKRTRLIGLTPSRDVPYGSEGV